MSRNIYKAVHKAYTKLSGKKRRKPLTYNDLRTKTYTELKKAGYTNLQIYEKSRLFYLKENRQLTADYKSNKDMSSVIRGINKGTVRKGVLISKTSKSLNINTYQNLKNIVSKLGENSLANTLLNEFRRGELSAAQLDKAMYTYSKSFAEYENIDLNDTPDSTQVIIKGYNESEWKPLQYRK